MKQKSVKRMSFFLALIFSLILCFVNLGSVFAVDLSEKDQETLDQKVERLKTERNNVTETKQNINQVETQIAEIEGIIQDLDARMAGTKAQIEALEKEYEIELIELEKRMRVMYMYGDTGYLELFFSPNGFDDIISRIEQVRSVMQSDRDQVNHIKEIENNIKMEISGLEKDKASAKALKTQQSKILSVYYALLALQELQFSAEKASADAIAQSMGFSGIDAYLANVEWPFDVNDPVSFQISSWFGYRDSPGGFGSSNHQGIDIIPGEGTPIKAIASGVVMEAGYTGGYGNCVVIEHGKNGNGQIIHSLYGHMLTEPLVSVGDYVVQGQIIGYVGSTGPSTGAHLHLEIWENKTPVDPMTYFEQYKDRCVFM